MRRLTAESRELDGRDVVVTSPSVGFWRTHLAPAAFVRSGDVIGTLEILGDRIEVVANAHGIVRESRAALAWRPVGYGEALLALDPRGTSIEVEGTHAEARVADAAGLVFAAPLSGRFFARSGPGKPPFVEVGAEVGPGQTICMLEVMKTFNRVTYGGPGLPERARVTAILVADEADVTMGQAILRLEPA
jgi:acetyl-CoA carboxylase biotin carboxyl carrier protein